MAEKIHLYWEGTELLLVNAKSWENDFPSKKKPTLIHTPENPTYKKLPLGEDFNYW